SPEPFSILAALLSRIEAGGVLVTNVKLRSAYAVINTGMIRSPSLAVRALNSLQNCMMFKPCCPRAGPTGGAGFAFPAGHCSLMIAVTFFMTKLAGGPEGEELAKGQPKASGSRVYAFSTWEKSSSTDVARPNIDSETLSFCLSDLTSSTVAEKLANGPSITRTESPVSKVTRALGLGLPPSLMLVWTPVISRSGTGVGLVPPRKPVI